MKRLKFSARSGSSIESRRFKDGNGINISTYSEQARTAESTEFTETEAG